MRTVKTTLLILFATPIYVMARVGPADCEAGYYRLADGAGIDIAPTDDTHFRWRMADGTSGLLTRKHNGTWTSSLGWTGRDDGRMVELSGCNDGQIRFDGATAKRVRLKTVESKFESGEVELAGRLVLPEGGAKVPIVVLVHGSEDTSALLFYALQRMLPAQGVGVFVYDKRGTGKSTGQFTHDLDILATDARLALEQAKRLAGRRLGRVGFYGTSQGGWTAPLAATSGGANFVIVGYGLAVSPVEEDREALVLDMTRHGFGAPEIEKALEIGSAAEAIARNGFGSGYEALHLLIDKYESEPWFAYVRGNLTGIVIRTPAAELRKQGPILFAGIDADYDPMPVLEKLKTPQLWILGGEDIDAPYAETYKRLLTLKKSGHAISVAVYPHVEHGLYAFETKGEERLSTRQPSSLLTLLTTFARGRPLQDRYEDATLTP